ncbi:conserved hypothetical protein (plasmid) [Borreliella spielmanii A14S]|uniref:Uncharacterized protein n=1 Tax=Borreliella spielmanii A14S TaxID=498742 RepID=C0RBT4_9SPIR|nr:conserved hypothetical protein [Borreliella spielmanii A14S]
MFPRNCYCVNSLYINYEKTPISIYKKLFIISIFNSLVFNFVIRDLLIYMFKNHVYINVQCHNSKKDEILSNPLYLNLTNNTSLLIAKNDSENFKYLLNLKFFKFSK